MLEGNSSKKILILGAGITGLALAYFLKKKIPNARIKILEASSRPGGWIQTVEKDGFQFELGPHSVRNSFDDTFKDTFDVIEELGLTSSIIAADPAAAKRYLFYKKALHAFPPRFSEIFSSPLARLLPKGLWNDFWAKPMTKELSIYDFFSNHFGQKIADTFADALTIGIFAGDPKKLSMQACFPSLWERQLAYGSILQSFFFKKKAVKKIACSETLPKIFSFQNGMQSLIDALQKKLSNEIFYHKIASTIFLEDKCIAVKCEDESAYQADQIYSTLPATKLALLVDDKALKHKLSSLSAANVALVSLGWHGDLLMKKGFGYLVPSNQQEAILGIIFSSSVFPEKNLNKTNLTVMIGKETDIFQSDEKLLKIALKATSSHLNISAAPDSYHIFRAQAAIPQYTLGAMQTIERAQSIIKNTYHNKLVCLGPFFGGGVSIPQCIKTAREIAFKSL